MELTQGWELTSTAPGAASHPAELAPARWAPAPVPGTAAGALGADARADFDAEDWWFRATFDLEPVPAGSERVVLELGGVATVSEVYLNGSPLLRSESMWSTHEIDITDRVAARNELAIVCRALRPLLGKPRRPRARWRTRVLADGNLRWYRTMIFGRSPGFAPAPAPVGPWREVRIQRLSAPSVRKLRCRPVLEGTRGRVDVSVEVFGSARNVQAELAGAAASLEPAGDGRWSGRLVCENVEPWWPHTHGDPALHVLTVSVDGQEVSRPVGFRTLSFATDIAQDGLELAVNGVPLFVRGAVWTPPDLVTMAPAPATVRRLLEQMRDAGMNMVRIPGTAAYEGERFHELCDELGILVWQDLMFANLDYPLADEDFHALARAEVAEVVQRLLPHPSSAVLCGNSEVEQQPAMMGLDPALGRGEFWEREVPELAAELGLDTAYVRSTPCGGALPFHSDRGVSHYFGVSGYFEPPAQARRAAVRFASECLAFANVPEEVAYQVHDPRWKQGVPRDAGTGWDRGAGWDFDDVRDRYLELLYGHDPVALRRSDPDRYMELSRFASGEVMAEVMGEWRRSGSPCRGALVLWLKDMVAGAGLGVLDVAGRPKLAYHHLRRALAPTAVWLTDEGVNGVAIHVAHDGQQPRQLRLRVALYRGGEVRVAEASEELALPGHASVQRTVEGMLGFFLDAAWAYRFGPAGHDVIVATLEEDGCSEPVSQGFLFTTGRPLARESLERLGLTGRLQAADPLPALELSSARLVYGVHLDVPGFDVADNGFSLEPGGTRTVALTPVAAGTQLSGATVQALNLETPMRLAVPETAG